MTQHRDYLPTCRPATNPPSIGSTTPVIQLAAELARYIIDSEISSETPSRPSGWKSEMRGLDVDLLTFPGATATTRTLRQASSIARFCERACSAAFAEEYAADGVAP